MVLAGGRVGGCGSISASFDPRLRSLHVGLSSHSLLSDSAFASSGPAVNLLTMSLLLLFLLYSFHPIAEIKMENANIKDEFK